MAKSLQGGEQQGIFHSPFYIFSVFLLPFPPSSLPSQTLQSDHLSKQFANLSWQLRQLWEPQQAENTGDSGQQGSQQGYCGWSLESLSSRDSFTVPKDGDVSDDWCLWRLKSRCQMVPNSWVQFVSGAPLEALPGSIRPLEGRLESLNFFSALSWAFLSVLDVRWLQIRTCPAGGAVYMDVLQEHSLGWEGEPDSRFSKYCFPCA